MKRIAIGIGILCLFTMVAKAQDGFTLEGSVGDLEAPALAVLEYRLDSEEIVDSASVQNGTFTFKGSVPYPIKSVLILYHGESREKTDREWMYVYLENTDIKVTAPDSLKNASISGSQVNSDNEDLKAFVKPLRDAYSGLQKRWTGINKPRWEGDSAFYKASDSVKYIMEALPRKYVEFALLHPDSYIGLEAYSLGGIPAGFDPVQAQAEFNQLSASVRNTPLGKRIDKTIANTMKMRVGAVLPNFSQEDTSGNVVELYDFKGKYVLIDFWASWCKPCRAENPNLLKAYNKLKDQNFEILGVSLDESRKGWLYAVKKDGMPWTQVSDLKGFKNEIARAFSISAIPQNILIDPKGVVLARNLRGEDLDEQLEKYLQ